VSESTKQSIKEFILTNFLPGEDPAALTDDYPLISGGVLDSIATLKLIMFLEEEFGIAVQAHEADKEHLDSLDLIAGLVEAKKAA
jgi:acyl carrier protein